jgi:hypothetical protein
MLVRTKTTRPVDFATGYTRYHLLTTKDPQIRYILTVTPNEPT